MKIKTSELSDAALRWAVAKCNGHEAITFRGVLVEPTNGLSGGLPKKWRPDLDWSQGGPLIANNIFRLEDYGDAWEAEGANGIRCRGETELIAVCRCVVASKLGEEVDVPEELL